MGTTTRTVAAGVVAASLAVALIPGRAEADGPACSGWDVEYTLAGTLKIADTVMGAGDGVHPVGPGRAVIHFEDRGGQPGGHAKLTAYGIHEHVTVTSRAAFFSATVVTDTSSKAVADGVITEGNLADRTLTWSGPIRAYRTDGTMTCDGSLCGKFGAPASGSSEVHMGPRTIQPAPFQFSPDLKTFSMPQIQTAQSDSPKQTTYEAISGREAKRTCVP